MTRKQLLAYIDKQRSSSWVIEQMGFTFSGELVRRYEYWQINKSPEALGSVFYPMLS